MDLLQGLYKKNASVKYRFTNGFKKNEFFNINNCLYDEQIFIVEGYMDALSVRV